VHWASHLECSEPRDKHLMNIHWCALETFTDVLWTINEKTFAYSVFLVRETETLMQGRIQNELIVRDFADYSK
jgi:hypothetical protein